MMGGGYRIYQLPIIRLPVQGSAWLSVFFLLTGFVNAYKPLKSLHNGDLSGRTPMLVSLSSNFVRRTVRMVLPPAIATLLGWALTEIGAYGWTENVDSFWLAGAPMPSNSVLGSLWRLATNLVTTWAFGQNAFDEIQWACPLLLRASYTVFLTLLATAWMRAGVRRWVTAGMALWCALSADCMLSIFHSVLSFSFYKHY